LKTRGQIKAFVEKLRAGEAVFEDEASEGRSKSLGASLSYGFDNAFSEEERKQLALLHFFQGFVDVDALCMMGNPQADRCLPEVRGLTREAGIALLDQIAEIGLLTSHGNGYYSIHPAVPWFFKRLFDQYYPATPGVEEAPSMKASHAFVEAIGRLGNFYAQQYSDGNSDVIGILTAEESNLLHARHLACRHGWWRRVISAMQGLDTLYDHTGRSVEWAQLVNEILPDFVDPNTDGTLPGREDYWSLITQYRVLLAREARQWSEAERLQRLRVDWNRQRAARALTTPQDHRDNTQRNDIRTLAVSLQALGDIQRELGQPECVKSYEESLNLAEVIGDRPVAAICAFNLGSAYLNISALIDLAQAERWYRRSLEMYEEHHRQDRAQCLGQLGRVAFERFLEARKAQQSEEEILRHLTDALQFYNQALELIPSNAVLELGVIHNALGVILDEADDHDSALRHYRESIRYHELRGHVFSAAQTRYSVAIALAQSGRLADAREYAYAALRNFETYGDRAAEQIQKAQRLIELIEQDMQEQGG
jgi:tetratricopeptide (TPR) repeat protein